MHPLLEVLVADDPAFTLFDAQDPVQLWRDVIRRIAVRCIT